MGEAAVDPEIIKRTQDTLGQIINAPALTDKLLGRPPVQFLQDIVKAVSFTFDVAFACLYFLLANDAGGEKDQFPSRTLLR